MQRGALQRGACSVVPAVWCLQWSNARSFMRDGGITMLHRCPIHFAVMDDRAGGENIFDPLLARCECIRCIQYPYFYGKLI